MKLFYEFVYTSKVLIDLAVFDFKYPLHWQVSDLLLNDKIHFEMRVNSALLKFTFWMNNKNNEQKGTNLAS